MRLSLQSFSEKKKSVNEQSNWLRYRYVRCMWKEVIRFTRNYKKSTKNSYILYLTSHNVNMLYNHNTMIKPGNCHCYPTVSHQYPVHGPGSDPGLHIAFICHVPLVFKTETVFSFFFIFHDLYTFEEHWSAGLQLSLDLGFAWVSSSLNSVTHFVKDTTEVMLCPS